MHRQRGKRQRKKNKEIDRERKMLSEKEIHRQNKKYINRERKQYTEEENMKK